MSVQFLVLLSWYLTCNKPTQHWVQLINITTSVDVTIKCAHNAPQTLVTYDQNVVDLPIKSSDIEVHWRPNSYELMNCLIVDLFLSPVKIPTLSLPNLNSVSEAIIHNNSRPTTYEIHFSSSATGDKWESGYKNRVHTHSDQRDRADYQDLSNYGTSPSIRILPYDWMSFGAKTGKKLSHDILSKVQTREIV